MSDFYHQLMASFPPGLQPPEALRRYFAWVDEQGLASEWPSGGIFALTDPLKCDTELVLTPVDTEHPSHWLGSDGCSRLAPFCRTGGDGSYAALWLDDVGQTHIVHLGSGSGSTLVGLLGQTPLDFLRLLAIGYEELCWEDQHRMTPLQIFEQEMCENYGEDKSDWPKYLWPPAVPQALRAWLLAEFGVTAPSTAWEIVGDMPTMCDDKPSADPFWQWLNKVNDWGIV